MERMKPVLLLGTVFGLHPISFSSENTWLKKALSFWCLVIFLLQLLDAAIILWALHQRLVVEGSGDPTVMLLTNFFRHVADFILNLIIRTFNWQACHFQQCLHHLEQFEHIYARKEDFKQRKIRRTMLAGFFLGVVWIGVSLLLAGPTFERMKLYLGSTFSMMQFALRFFTYNHILFFYLSLATLVFLLCQRIDLMIETVKNFVTAAAEKSTLTYKPNLSSYYYRDHLLNIETIKKLLNHITWAADRIVDTYSVFIVTILSIKTTLICVWVFRLVQFLLPGAKEDRMSLHLSNTVLAVAVDSSMIMLLCYLADVLVDKVYELRMTIADACVARLSLQNKMDVKFLLADLDVSRFQLQAGGLFGIGRYLYPGILGTLITYIIILIQSETAPTTIPTSNTTAPAT